MGLALAADERRQGTTSHYFLRFPCGLPIDGSLHISTAACHRFRFIQWISNPLHDFEQFHALRQVSLFGTRWNNVDTKFL